MNVYTPQSLKCPFDLNETFKKRTKTLMYFWGGDKQKHMGALHIVYRGFDIS